MTVLHPVGFFALWHNKQSEYHASTEEFSSTNAHIQRAFQRGEARGIHMFPRYGCRWSAERQYFTFWVCPDMPSLEATMDDLEKACDFKFADSEHIIGVQLPDVEMTDEDYLVPGAAYERLPIALFAIWRRTDAYHRSGGEAWRNLNRNVRQVFDKARAQGVRMLGRYDCRWSSAWDYFTFWLAPSFEVLENIIEQLEPAGDFWYADSRHIIGNEEPYFRCGRHLPKVK
jgi:hypothetical protein